MSINVDIQLVGGLRSFGKDGPAYQILEFVGEKSPMHCNGAKARHEPHMHIRVLETGEELDYPVQKILQDPAAQ